MDSLKNIFTVSELRNRVLFTLGLLGVYRVGHHITVPLPFESVRWFAMCVSRI